MGKTEDPEVAAALLGAMAMHLSPEGGALLQRRLDMGACKDRARGRFNVGALKDLSFGHAERYRVSIGQASLSAEAIVDHQQAYRRGVVAWVPYGALPRHPAERVQLYDERRVGGVEGREEDDLFGVGLASFPTLDRAADELVRYVFRAAPRDWAKVGAAELRALDRYPDLARVAVPGAPELTAPLGWDPGVGPSSAAEETFRKLVADWEGFEALGARVLPDDAGAWARLGEAWRRRTLLPGEVGDWLVAEVARARRIRAELVAQEGTETVTAPLGSSAEGEDSVDASPKEGVVRTFFGKVFSQEVILASGFMAATIATFFGSTKSTDPPSLGSGKTEDEPSLISDEEGAGETSLPPEGGAEGA